MREAAGPRAPLSTIVRTLAPLAAVLLMLVGATAVAQAAWSHQVPGTSGSAAVPVAGSPDGHLATAAGRAGAQPPAVDGPVAAPVDRPAVPVPGRTAAAVAVPVGGWAGLQVGGGPAPRAPPRSAD